MIVEYSFAVGFGGSLATIFEIVVAFVSTLLIGWVTSNLLESSSERIVESFSDWTEVVGFPGFSRPPRKPPDKFFHSKSRSPVDC